MHQPKVGGHHAKGKHQEVYNKCAETKSSQISNTDFHYNKEEGNFHPGKHGSPVLSNEYGGHKKP